MSWLLWRDFIVNRRTPIASKILVAQILVRTQNSSFFRQKNFFQLMNQSFNLFKFEKIISLFFGLIYLQLSNDENGAMNRNGLLFILMMNSGN